MPDQTAALAPPVAGWTEDIDAIRTGNWRSAETGETAPRAPFDQVVIADDLDGGEADLVAGLGLPGACVIVADTNTWDAMGARIARALPGAGTVVLDTPHADLAEAAALTDRVAGAGHVIAVGGGTVNDLCKYVTAADGRPYAVFGTAASMDGYTSTTASMTLDSGLKVSVPAQAARGVFLDLSVNAAAPPRLAAAGFGDSICRSVCQIDWWMSHRLLGTFYTGAPYEMARKDEGIIMQHAAAIGRGELGAIGYLQRVLVLSGLGVAFTGVSNHGSMGEHQISHYIDCFAGDRHPGTTHGEQVGVATLTMARIQAALLGSDTPPALGPTRIDEADMARRMGPEIAAQCAAEYRKKALDADGAAAMSERLADLWPDLRRECLSFAVPVPEMEALVRAAGGPVNAAEMGLDPDFYREAVRRGHEMRNRFSFVDLACDAGLLDDLAAAEG